MGREEKVFTKLRELRRAKGLSIETLASKLGENSQKVARIERGDRSLTVDYLVKASKVLEAPLNAFIDQRPSEQTSGSTEVLSDIILWVEQHFEELCPDKDPKKKAQIIAKLFETMAKVPDGNKGAFLTGLLELCSLFKRFSLSNIR